MRIFLIDTWKVSNSGSFICGSFAPHMVQIIAECKEGGLSIHPKIKFTRKIIIMGEGGVGKTSLISQYVSGKFTNRSEMTIDCDFFSKKIHLTTEYMEVDGILSLWDLSGQTQFRAIIEDNMKGAHAVIFMYDMSRLITLIKLKEWIEKLKSGKIPIDGTIPIILVGTKKDLFDPNEEENGQFKQDEYIEEIKKECKIGAYFETSSLKGENIEEPFDFLIDHFIGEELKKQ